MPIKACQIINDTVTKFVCETKIIYLCVKLIYFIFHDT